MSIDMTINEYHEVLNNPFVTPKRKAQAVIRRARSHGFHFTMETMLWVYS